jgi:hypothetical protein
MKNKFNLNQVLKNLSNGDCSMINSFSKKELELICIVKGIKNPTERIKRLMNFI